MLRSRTGTKVCLPVVRFNFDGQAKLWCVCLFSLHSQILSLLLSMASLNHCILWADNLFLVLASGPEERRGEQDRNGKIERDLVGFWYVRFEFHPRSPLTTDAPFSHFYSFSRLDCQNTPGHTGDGIAHASFQRLGDSDLFFTPPRLIASPRAQKV